MSGEDKLLPASLNGAMRREDKEQPPPAAADAHLLDLLSNLLQEAESLTNQEEVELRAKIEALGLEVRKVPSKSTHLDEKEIAEELDKLSAKLDDVDEMISSALASDPLVKNLLSSTADVWLPIITASSDERRKFNSLAGEEIISKEKVQDTSIYAQL